MDKSLFISSFRKFSKVPTALICCIVLFLLAELAVSLLWKPAIIGQRLYQRFDTSYNYAYSPDTPKLFLEGDIWKYYPTQYVNIHPFVLRKEKAANEFRIFTLGGSVSRGKPRINYSFMLGNLLNQKHNPTEWKVVNLSADGIGSTRMYRFMKNIVSYKPDALIIHVHGTNEYEDERDFQYRGQVNSGMNNILYQSKFLVVLKKIYSRLVGGIKVVSVQSDDEVTASKNPKNVTRWDKLIERNIAKIHALAIKLKIPVVYIGRAERDEAGFSNSRVQRLNRHIVSMKYYIDTAAIFEKHSDLNHNKQLLFSDDTHWTSFGHKIIADEIYKFLISNNLLARGMPR